MLALYSSRVCSNALLEAKLPVCVTPMANHGDIYYPPSIINAVNDTPVADSYAPQIGRTLELLATRWPRRLR
jgi:hypothetical protein